MSALRRILAASAIALTSWAGLMPASHAATTELANAPLFTSSSSLVKPNIMFILDDSGSMGNNYLPDDAGDFTFSQYGRRASQCNGLAYNPKTDYKPPVDDKGVAKSNGALNPISTNPNTRFTSGLYTLSDASLTIASSGSLTVTVKGGGNSTFPVGERVTIFSTSSTTDLMEGTVTDWNYDGWSKTGSLTITLTDAIGTGTLASTLKVVASERPHYWKYTGTQTPLSYTYTNAGVITTTDFYRQCASAVGSAPGSGVFEKVYVSTASAEAQNYANWYTYYRTRMDMMKAAVSHAFKDIGERYRVGYTTISETTAKPGTKFLDIDAFDAAQKKSFYDKLFAAAPGSYTPLRGALSKAGQYYAKVAPSQEKDPIQYACQKNFTILSTDGYWNTQNEVTDTYGPYGVDKKLVGQQDADEDFPMRDASLPRTTTVYSWTTTDKLKSWKETPTTSYVDAQKTVATTWDNGTGSVATTYAGVGRSTISTAARCSNTTGPCTITVTTATNHGYTTGQYVAISGVNPTAYNGRYQVTVTGLRTFTYSLASRPSSYNNGGTIYDSTGCAAGTFSVTATSTQTDTFKSTVTTSTTATKRITTVFSATTLKTTETPYTQTVVVVNGVETAGTPKAGTATVTTETLTDADPTVVDSPYSASSAAAGSNNVQTTALPTVTQCLSSIPATKTVAATPVAAKPADGSTTTPTTIASSTGAVATKSSSEPTVTSAKTKVSEVSDTTGGQSNTLADIAEYYYKTDLRTTALGNCTGALGGTSNVCETTDISSAKTNVTQNMQTFTLGLGVNGTLRYSTDYLTNPKNSDYYDLTQGTKRWPNPTVSAGGGDPTNIDDLWHAAVNGRGQYFSAGDPDAVVRSLTAALAKINEIRGSSSAAATSTLQPTQDDRDIFVAEFTSGQWIGDVRKYSLNVTDGTVPKTADWVASEVLKARLADNTKPARAIYYFKKGTGYAGSLRSFDYDTLKADSLNSYFDGFCSKAGAGGATAPAQCGTLDTTGKATANDGANLVSWLRGTESTVFRARRAPLGDIINSSPLYVGKPAFKYTENSYGTFVSTNASRAGVLYVGANDGMLHAFDRTTGEEKWAFMPSVVLPSLYRLADTGYAANHEFYVDGTLQVGDVYDSSLKKWRTILVGGMNKGGKVYYALDITDPDNPEALWEFSDSNLGFTYGNPIITKRKSGKWVVAFGSGYNNVGDGNGYLFVVDALSGAKDVTPVATYTTGTTPAGTADTPSGLSKINAYVESDIDNTAVVFYGGDLLGNLWRFDIDSNVKPHASAFLLAQLIKDSTPQPITTKPLVAVVNQMGSTYKVVYVATGRYLGSGDLTDTATQSVYAIKDLWDETGLGDIRGSKKLVQQSITTDAKTGLRKASTNKVAWSTDAGWFVDFPSTGERVNVNMILTLNVLSVATNIPTSDVCDAGGRSYLYKFDIGTGSAMSNAPDGAVGWPLGNVLVAGQTVVQLPAGDTVTITTLSDATLRTDKQPPPPAAGTLRRTSWRELAN